MLHNKKAGIELDTLGKIVIGILVFLVLIVLIVVFNKSNISILDNLGF